jgi:hypothetical protein
MADIIVPDDQATIVAGLAAATAGDVVRIKAGTYVEAFAATLVNSGTALNPIIVEPFGDGDVIWQVAGAIKQLVDASLAPREYWVFRSVSGSSLICEGRHTLGNYSSGFLADLFTYEGVTFRDNPTGSLWCQYVQSFTVTDCTFVNVRSGILGTDIGSGILIDRGGFITIQDSHFEDLGDDGVHAGRFSAYQIAHVEVLRCQFVITHTRDGPWGNTGENGIDLKNTDDWLIQDCYFEGFRFCDPATQDASGSNGEALVIQEQGPTGPVADNTTVERCEFNDSEIAIWMQGNATNAIDTVDVINCYIHDMYDGGAITYGVALWAQAVTGLTVYHSTMVNNRTGIRNVANAGNTVELRNNVWVDIVNWIDFPDNVPGNWDGDYNFLENAGGPPAEVTGPNDVVSADLELDGDGKPAETSDVVDAGVTGLGVTVDLESTLRDAFPDGGCFEFVPSPPISSAVAGSGSIGFLSSLWFLPPKRL